MASAGPVDQQHRLVAGVVEVADDLPDENVDQPLLGARIG
jgi:hypothetical protein